MVKDPDNSQAIDLGHSAFSFPRKHWDKILSSPNFRDMPQVELVKLLLMYPKRKDENVFVENIRKGWSGSDHPLSVHLPRLHFLDIKSRGKVQNNKLRAEFVLLSCKEEEFA